MTSDELNHTSGIIVDAAVKLHRKVGPGLLESVYETLLADALRARGLRVERQVQVRIEIDGRIFDEAFRADLIVDDAVIIELKSTPRVTDLHKQQLLTYLTLSRLPLGLLLNFGAATMFEGITRRINQGKSSQSAGRVEGVAGG